MKLTLILYVFVLYEMTKGKSNDETNFGASTSRMANNEEQQLPIEEECEITDYIDNTINLLLEDILANNNPGRNPNLPGEFERSTIYFSQIVFRLRYGNSYTTANHERLQLLPNYYDRISYFTRGITAYAIERMVDVETQKYSECFPQIYDNSTQILFQENPEFVTNFHLLAILSRLDIMLLEINEDVPNLANELGGDSARSRRSLMPKQEKCYSLKGLSKIRLNELILYLMKILIKTQDIEESTFWLCDFVYLYTKYKFNSSLNSFNDCPKTKFGNFLYSRISHIQDWKNCLEFDESEDSSDWCQAWIRIMLNSDISIMGSLRNTPIEKFERDSITVTRWLWEKISATSDRSEQNLSFKEESKELVCVRDGFSASCPNFCGTNKVRETHEIEKRSLFLNNNLFYEREWYKNDYNKLRCLCRYRRKLLYQTANSEFYESTPKSSTWFNFRCDEDSEYHNSPRCDELRRKRNLN